MVGTTLTAGTTVPRRPRLGARRHKLGLWMATALVVGNMIGSGVFLLPSSLAAYGGISIVAWGVTAVGAMTLAVVFARLGRAFPHGHGDNVVRLAA
jgi:basic amino acid/polyamine antiporter, APA family